MPKMLNSSRRRSKGTAWLISATYSVLSGSSAVEVVAAAMPAAAAAEMAGFMELDAMAADMLAAASACAFCACKEQRNGIKHREGADQC